DRRLARARIAREAHMHAGLLGLDPDLRPRLGHEQKRRDLAHPLLDGREADEVVVELLDDVADMSLGEHRLQVDARRRGRNGWRVRRGVHSGAPSFSRTVRSEYRTLRPGPSVRMSSKRGSRGGRFTRNDRRTLSKPRVASNAFTRMDRKSTR